MEEDSDGPICDQNYAVCFGAHKILDKVSNLVLNDG